MGRMSIAHTSWAGLRGLTIKNEMIWWVPLGDRNSMKTPNIFFTLVFTLISALPSTGRAATCIVGRSELGVVITGITRGIGHTPKYCRDIKEPYVLITSGVHGDEAEPSGLLALIASDRGTQMTLSTLPLLMIPAVNPDGLTRETRQNALGVDLNRNFPGRHIFKTSRRLEIAENPGGIDYEASEMSATARLIKKSLAYIDLHGFATSIYHPYSAYKSTDHHMANRSFIAALNVALNMRLYFGERYLVVDGHERGDIGSSDEYAATLGLPTVCIEMSRGQAKMMSGDRGHETAQKYVDIINQWLEDVLGHGKARYQMVSEKRRH